MISKLFIVCIIIVCSCVQLNAVEYTLEDLYKIALQRSEMIKISEEELFISEKGKDKAMSLLIPKVSGTGSYTGYKDQKTSDTGSLTQPSEATSWSLRLDQSLSTSGREITAFKMAKDNIEKSRQELFSTKEAYAMHVANAYYDVLKAGKIVEISQQNIERLKKYRNAASTRLKLGEVTKTALLRAEAELSGAQSDLIKAKNVFKSTKTVLQRTVGLDEEFDIYDIYKSGLSGLRNISEGNKDPLLLNCVSLNVECLRDVAYGERAEIKAFTIQKNIADAQVRYARGADWPTLSIEGVYVGKHESPETTSLIRDSVYGGVRLNFPFFEGGLRRAEIQEAMAKKGSPNMRWEI